MFGILDEVMDVVEDATGVSKRTQTAIAGTVVTSAVVGAGVALGAEVVESIFDDSEDDDE